MIPYHPAEMIFYIDGELGPDEAAELEAWLEGDSTGNDLCDAFLRQKEMLARVLEALVAKCCDNRQTDMLQKLLADALCRRLADE